MEIYRLFQKSLFNYNIFLRRLELIAFLSNKNQNICTTSLSRFRQKVESKPPSGAILLYLICVASYKRHKKKIYAGGGVLASSPGKKMSRQGSRKMQRKINDHARAREPRSSRKTLNQSSWPVSRPTNVHILYLRGAQIATHLITVQYPAGGH